MGSVLKTVVYNITRCKIIGVEKGNVGQTTIDETVIAFSLQPDGEAKKYKVIAKGALAYNLYHIFLAQGNSISGVTELEGGVKIDKEVFISLTAELKEGTTHEVKLRNPSDIRLSYNYKIA